MTNWWKISFLALLVFIIIGANVAVWFSLIKDRSTNTESSIISPIPTSWQTTVTPSPIPTLTLTPTPTVDDADLIKQAVLSKLKLNENQAVLTISQITDQYAKGNIRQIDAVSGGYFLAAKTQGTWVVVYDGQANPTCDQIAPYNFPQEMVPECLDTTGKVVQR